ncbi:MAG: VOC family protein [Parachlamydiaceae bacterium]|nr:MAG: VOC family protein [Parachlamydiaceae bacterium]
MPEGFHTVTPYLTLKNAAKAIQFYKDAFGAKEIEIHHAEDGRILNASIQIGNSMVMLCDEFPEFGCGTLSPQSMKGTTIVLHIYVEDVDALFNQALHAGAKVKMPVENMFWGDRYGQLEDPFGYFWSIATRIADESTLEDSHSQQCCKH